MNVCSNSGRLDAEDVQHDALCGDDRRPVFNVHDDNWPSDPSYMLVDDITVQ